MQTTVNQFASVEKLKKLMNAKINRLIGFMIVTDKLDKHHEAECPVQLLI